MRRPPSRRTFLVSVAMQREVNRATLRHFIVTAILQAADRLPENDPLHIDRISVSVELVQDTPPASPPSPSPSKEPLP